MLIELRIDMEAFARTAPEWTKNATHALSFCCPRCHGDSRQAKRVWLNRYCATRLGQSW